MPDGQTTKHSYTVPCSTVLRDAALDLARRRRVNVADLVRSVLLVAPPAAVAAAPDPGEPVPGDREQVVLKSGRAQGRPWRRKPRLQVRLAPGYDIPTIRRAVGLALAMDRGEAAVRVGDPATLAGDGDESAPVSPFAAARPAVDDESWQRIRSLEEEVERLRAIVSALSFEPLAGGVQNRADALYVFGFPPGATPSSGMVRARFRMLATIHHPDGHQGSHQRMSQLNAAMEVLRRGGL